MNSGINYGGYIDWIMFYALSAILHPYKGGMFQAMIVIICINNIGMLRSDSSKLKKLAIASKGHFTLHFVPLNFPMIYTY